MAKKRWGIPDAKPGELKAKYGREELSGEADIQYCWSGEGGSSKRDARILSDALEHVPVCDGNSLRKELELRGYDITTLKFSVMKKAVVDVEYI